MITFQITVEEKRVHQAERFAEALKIYQFGECPEILAPNLILKSSNVILQFMDTAGKVFLFLFFFFPSKWYDHGKSIFFEKL